MQWKPSTLEASTKEVTVTIPIIEITHDSNVLNSFYSVGDIYKDHYYAYNQGTHAIDVYSIGDEEHLRTITLEDQRTLTE